jgi:hypothetical protein
MHCVCLHVPRSTCAQTDRFSLWLETTLTSYLLIYRVIENSRSPFLARVLFVKKIHWNQKTKNNVVLNVENVHSVQRCMHSLFSSCFMQPGEELLQWPETVHQTRYCRFVWHRTIGKCIPKLILASWVRTRCQVVFDNEHAFHLWKRHPCTSAVERQLMGWREQFTTWRDLRGLLYNQSNIVC